VSEERIKSHHMRRIEQFMKLAGQELPASPCIPDVRVRKLRARLIYEEAREAIIALGFACPNLSLYEEHPSNLVKIVDGCCDSSVVTIGTLLACGVPDLPFIKLVDENNLAKFGSGGYRRGDGKWVKPPDHRPPDIAGLLKKYGWEGGVECSS